MQISDGIGRRIKLHDLHILMAVAETGSMGKAAQRLNTSQPNISRSIATLEQMFGVQLLERSSQGVEPTEYGRALIDCGLSVFDGLHQGVKNIEFLADPSVGELRIGANHFLTTSFVPSIIDRLSRRYPGITFHIESGDGKAVVQKLKNREVDLLVTWKSPHHLDESISFAPLYEDAQVVVAGAQSPWAKRRKIKLAELLDEPWVLSPPYEGTLGAMAMRLFSAGGLAPPRTTVFSFVTDARLSLLGSGRFLTICTTSALKLPRARPDIKILPVDVPIESVPIGIASLKNRMLSPVTRLFVEQAKEVAAPLAKMKR
jgi:DNA-binding transcriptional LysR family regulator